MKLNPAPSPNGRDNGGRFALGNRAGKGNPHHRRVAQLRAAMLERVTPDDMAAVVEALLNKAKAGDAAAIKLLLDRMFGRIADYDAAAAEDRAEREVQRIKQGRERTEAERERREFQRFINEVEQWKFLQERASKFGIELPG